MKHLVASALIAVVLASSAASPAVAHDQFKTLIERLSLHGA